MTDLVVATVRKRLASAGQRRTAQLHNAEEMATEIRSLVADAQTVKIPLSEVARTLHMDRSTLYRTYVDA